MSDKHVRRLARAVRTHASRSHHHHGNPHQYAVVTDVSPLSAELVEGALELQDDDLSLSQWVKRYDRDYGIAKGDTLLLMPTHDGDWLVTDVVSDTDIPTTPSP